MPAALPIPGRGAYTPQGMVARQLASWIRNKFEQMQRFRTSIGYDDRLLTCLRQRQGQYDPSQLNEIERFGGSKVFARLTANKCRGAAAMLREIYITSERPWTVEATPVPTLPGQTLEEFKAAFMQQAEMAISMGAQIDPQQADQAVQAGLDRLFQQHRDIARDQAQRATRYIDDLLVEGGFYDALDMVLEDFVTYPLAVMKGPVAIMKTDVHWVRNENGMRAQLERRPVLMWDRVDPGDIWWSPGARTVQDAEFIERLPNTRAAWNGLIGLPGYDDKAIRDALRDYGDSGLQEPADFGWDAKADLENRNTWHAENHLIDGLVFTGAVQGWELEEQGVSVPDKDMDYLLQCFLIGEYMIKLQVDPDPRQRMPYYIASYEPVPNSIVGNALPELFADIQQISNATLRALVNNLSIASGPQVVINTSALIEPGDSESLYPWKRWKVQSDPLQPNQRPVDFFQPDSRSQDLMMVFAMFSNLADEVSAVPKYLTGNERVGGAGRTASGLAMLMQNSSRVMQSVSASIDTRMIEPAVQKAYDMVLLSSEETPLQGDENIRARGATHAKAREADKMRLLEFFNLVNASPMAMQALGPQGYNDLLRRITLSLGVDIEELISRNPGMGGGQPGMNGGPPPQGGPPGGATGPGPTPGGGGAGPAGPIQGMTQNRGGGMGPIQSRMASAA